MNSSWSESLLRDRKAFACTAQQVALRHPAVFVFDFGVTGVITAFVAHHADVSHELKSGRRYRHDDLARAFIRILTFRIRYRHHDRKARAFSGRSEPLVAIDDVVVTILHGRRAHPRRIRSRML